MPSPRPPAPPDDAAPPGLPEARPPAPALSWVHLLAVAVPTALAYANSLDVPFHFDDFGLAQNESLRDLRRMWPPRGPRWVGDLSFALNYRLGGLEVLGYHLVNLAVHLGNALLLYALAATTLRSPRMRGWEAGSLVGRYLPLAAALLFALHPLATQAVTYVVQRYASLATLFFLLSVVLYARARLAPASGGRALARAAVPYGLALLSAAAAMRTKQIAFTLPAVVAAYELLFLEGRARTRVLLLAPLAATALLVPLAHLDGSADVARAAAETEAIPRWTYLLTQTRVVVTYLRLLVLPVGQNLDYDYPLSHSLGEPAVLLALGILGAVGAAAAAALVVARRTRRVPGAIVAFGVAWFFVTLAVESSLIPIRDVIFEHRAYLPGAGAALALGTALLRGVELLRLRAPPAAQCAAALLLVAGPLGVATHLRNRVWRDELTLWSDVVAKSPGKARPHNYLGIALAERGDRDAAMAQFQLALRLKPWFADALLNLGNLYRERGDHADALRLYQRAVLVAPQMATARNNLGGMYELLGRLEEAEREYAEALRLKPGMPEAQGNLARLRSRRRSGAPPR